MNDFYNESNSALELKIKKGTSCDAINMLKEIDSVFPPKSEGEFNIVYIYYLINEKFIYPNGESNVLYIGCTKGEKNNGVCYASFRFKHLRSGSDNKQNVTLSYYYEKDYEIGLDIYDVNDCVKLEKELRISFLSKFSSFPIADGCSYKKQNIIIDC